MKSGVLLPGVWLLVTLVVLAAVPAAAQEDVAATQQADRTPQEQAAVATAARYLRAVAAGDAAAVRPMLAAKTPQEVRLADAFAELLAASRQLQVAGQRRFTSGPAGDIPLPEPAVQGVTITDGQAQVRFADREPLPLVSSEAGWQIDTRRLVAGHGGLFAPGPAETPADTPADATDEAMDEQARLLGEMTLVIRRTAQEIDNGRFTKADDARAVLGQRLSEVIARGTSGMTPPAKPPSEPPATAPTAPTTQAEP